MMECTVCKKKIINGALLHFKVQLIKDGVITKGKDTSTMTFCEQHEDAAAKVIGLESELVLLKRKVLL